MLKYIAAALVMSAGMAAAEDIKIGVSPGEHAEILEQVAPIAAAKGLNLDIVEFSDYVVPNTALADGDLQANSFQHVPYLENQIKDRGYDLVVVAKTITTPMGVYSSKLKSLGELADGATVVAYDENDLNVFREVVARSLYAAGGRPGMVFHNAYGYGLFTGGLGTDGGGQRLGLCTIPVSGGGTDKQVQLIQDLEPEIIACTPSYALVLAEALKKAGMKPDDISLKYAVLGAEPWSNKCRAEVEEKLGLKATNIYGLSEVIGPGVSNEDAAEQRRQAEYDRLEREREDLLTPVYALEEQIEEQRLREIAAYGEAVKERVETAARALPGLAVPVLVDVDLTWSSHLNRHTDMPYVVERLVEQALMDTPAPEDLPGTPLSRLLEASGRPVDAAGDQD
mgnify:CR=1 FL=1